MRIQTRWRIWKLTIGPWLTLFHRFELITGIHTGTFELWFGRQFDWMVRDTGEVSNRILTIEELEATTGRRRRQSWKSKINW